MSLAADTPPADGPIRDAIEAAVKKDVFRPRGVNRPSLWSGGLSARREERPGGLKPAAPQGRPRVKTTVLVEPGTVATLEALVAIPGISASTYPASEVRRAAAAVAETLIDDLFHENPTFRDGDHS